MSDGAGFLSSGSRPTAVTRPVGKLLGSGTSATMAILAFRHRAEDMRQRQLSHQESSRSLAAQALGPSASHHSLTAPNASGIQVSQRPTTYHELDEEEHDENNNNNNKDNDEDAGHLPEIDRAEDTIVAIDSPPPSPPRAPMITDITTAAPRRALTRLRASMDRRADLVQAMINASPGCFDGDDGSVDTADRYNFYAHGRRFLFATNSLGYFTETSALRRRVVWLITSRAFDRVVLALIFANSILLALPDLSQTRADGSLDSTHSWRNAVVTHADDLFTALFSVEGLLKILAMGLFGERGAYLMDPWNWIDFVVVLVGLVGAVPGMTDVSWLRALRVLRPLRFFNAVPGIKRLVTALLRSIPELLSVVAFLLLLFFLYGVIGVQLWSGVLHARCRLTPFPVRLDPALTLADVDGYQRLVMQNASAFQCLDEQDEVLALQHPSWTHDSSPWHHPRVCYWPVAPESAPKVCNQNLNDGGALGYRQCPPGQTCGSNYDAHGNFRFTHPDATVSRVLLHEATYTSAFNYGVTTFDHIGAAALVVFLCMPREGWTDTMYMLQDAGYDAAAVVYFVSFLLLGSYVMLNLALAVIWENFYDQSLLEQEQEQTARHTRASHIAAAHRLEIARRSMRAGQSGDPPHRRRGCAIAARVLQHRAFNGIRVVLILVNTVILSLDQYPIDATLENAVSSINFALTLAFSAEVGLKLLAMGVAQWRVDGYNLLEALLVVASLADMGLAPPAFLSSATAVTSSSSPSSVSGLRSIRILALFKLTRYWPSLQRLLETIVHTVREIGNFSVLLLLFMYVYALIGMQLFGNRFFFDAYGYPTTLSLAASSSSSFRPRAHFDTILWSMVTIFQVLTGENWTTVLFDGWRAIGWPAALYFLSLVVLGNFILLNLFLAILLSNFEDTRDDLDLITTEKEELRKKSRVAPIRNSLTPSDSHVTATIASISRNHPLLPHGSGSITAAMDAIDKREKRRSSLTCQMHSHAALAMHASVAKERARQASSSSAVPTNARTASVTPMSAVALAAMNQRSAQTASSSSTTPREPPKTPQGRSLGLFAPRSWVRRQAWAVVHHPSFETALFVLVVASTVTVALDNPLAPPQSTLVVALAYADMLLSIGFLVAVVLYVVAQGLYGHEFAYLRNNWNVLDFAITLVAVSGLLGNASHNKFLQTLRMCRALRPIRLINRTAGMKLVVSSLFAAVPQMLNVLMVSVLLLLIFSVLAVNHFKGKFYSCHGDAFDALSFAQQQLVTTPRPWPELSPVERSWFNASTAALYASLSASTRPLATTASSASSSSSSPSAVVTSRRVCEFLNATWARTIPQSFDNVLLGWRTFFEISTTEGWTTIMLTSVDATALDMQPITNHRERWTLFFIAFIFMGSFFILQLFIGVVIENFNRMKEKLDGTYQLSGPQREWLMISEAMLHLKPQRRMRIPRNVVRRLCFSVSHSARLEMAIMGCVVLNTFIMALTYFGEEDLYAEGIAACNYFFALVFTLEAIVKIIGLGRYYWKDSWNVFDFLVVAGSCAGMAYAWVSGSTLSTATVRSVRVARLVKLIQTWPSLRQLTNTLLITLPSLANIGGLLFLIFFIYAALGVQLFAKVRMGQLITRDANFQSLTRAMITLVRCATGERWNDMMHELARTDSSCVPDPDYDPAVCGFSDAVNCQPLQGCGTDIAFFYFCSFTMLVTFVLLNIFVAVILEGFANEKDRANGVLLPQHYKNFVATWSTLDPEATGFLEWHLLPKFLQQLDEPLGFGDNYEASNKEMKSFIKYLDMTIYNGNKVFFSDVARQLGKFVLDVVNGTSVEELPPNIEVDQKWRALLRGSKIRKLERATHRLNHIHAAVLIHESVTSLVFREELVARVAKYTELAKIYSAPPPESSPRLRKRSPRRGLHRRNNSRRSFNDSNNSVIESQQEIVRELLTTDDDEDDCRY